MVLAGIKVLDVGSYVAGPAAATVMGDFGAEVIKIEPPEGDPYRSLHRLPGSPVGDRDYYWVGGIAKLEDLAGDRQMLETGALTPLADPDAGAVLTVNSPVFYDGVVKVAPGRAPRIGEHTDEVLRTCGYGEAEIEVLRRAGVVTGSSAVHAGSAVEARPAADGS